MRCLGLVIVIMLSGRGDWLVMCMSMCMRMRMIVMVGEDVCDVCYGLVVC